VARTTTIIPVASGKGGVGKTLLTANLAVALAESGHPTLAVDLDLGNSNLHSLLGLRNRHSGIGDYLRTAADSLATFVVETGVPNLTLLAGDGQMPFMANVTHAQKQRLLREIKKLPAELVLLDLGAGSSFNTLDLFGISASGILVTTVEYPSLVSMLVFVKNHALRLINRALRRHPELDDLLHEMLVQPITSPQLTVASLRERARQINPQAAVRIDEICRGIRPRVIYNMGDDPGDLRVVEAIDESLEQTLSLRAEHLGFVFHDPEIRNAFRERVQIAQHIPECHAARNIEVIADRIARLWNQEIPDSGRRLAEHTRQQYDQLRSQQA
jgi:flagellar biosynthesis protein FlhG